MLVDNNRLIYSNTDNNGNKLLVWKGPSLKPYPKRIADYDAVFYIETEGKYRFTIRDQLKLEDLILSIVVLSGRRKEKAQLFIDTAKKHRA